MKITLPKEFYPQRYVQFVCEEFTGELLSVQVKDETDVSYTIELVSNGIDQEVLARKFLNRFLEKTITEKFG